MGDRHPFYNFDSLYRNYSVLYIFCGKKTMNPLKSKLNDTAKMYIECDRNISPGDQIGGKKIIVKI